MAFALFKKEIITGQIIMSLGFLLAFRAMIFKLYAKINGWYRKLKGSKWTNEVQEETLKKYCVKMSVFQLE